MSIRDLRGALTLKAVFLAGLAAPAAWFGTHHAHAPAIGSWALVFDRPAVGKYEDISFPDSLNGWIVAERGEILHSTDGGKTWGIQATGMPGLRSVDFLDKNRGFAGALTGKLYGTTNGGVTWTDISSTLPKQVPGFCGITHVGKHVHIVGRYNGAVADYFYSPDAGKTWRYTDLREYAQALVDVAFVNDNVGFIGGMSKSDVVNTGQPILLKTTDGGKSWRVVFHHDGGRGYVWKLWPINQKVLYASLQSQDGIYRAIKTVDAGEHWDTLIVATGRPMGFGVQGIGFLDENTGWVGGFFRGLWATTDAGKSWSAVHPSDATINRFEKVGGTMVTAGSRGVLRYDARRPEGP